MNEDSLHTLTVLQSGPPSLGFIVTGLNCYTKYQFFLVPFNSVEEGRPSNMQEVRTLADGMSSNLIFLKACDLIISEYNSFIWKFFVAPTAPPSQLEAKFLNISTVSITWSAPPSVSHNGLIESYEVNILHLNFFCKKVSEIFVINLK